MNSRSPAIVNRIRAGVIALLFLLGGHAAAAQAGPPAGSGDYQALLDVFTELQRFKNAAGDRGLPDYGSAAIRARRQTVETLQQRMRDMGVAAWSVPQQVDYLTVRAELDQQQFILEVTRPWARDPVFYIAGLLEIAFTELPVDGENLAVLQSQLAAIPESLSAARRNLTDVAADYADLAIRSLVQSDGVEDGYPRRPVPPSGVIGWYEDLLARADSQPVLKPQISAALTALRDFHQWLLDNRGTMNKPNGVGKEALDWFVQYALLLPYTSDAMVELAKREFDRLWGFYALEQHRNRDLPELKLSSSKQEYQQRLADTDKLVKSFLRDEEFISIPDYIPQDWREMGYNVPFIVRATPPNFWEQVQFRDPFPDHVHAVIPGHRYDALYAKNIPHPIRSQVSFGARWQGWAVYLEEASLQAGALAERPRTRELIYIFGIWRAARTLGDIYNQWNRMTAGETAEYWLSTTPMLDPDVARKYAYLRPAPGHGLEYTIGNIEMWKLLSDVRQQLGDGFVLQDFHDEFMSKGRIPISLIRYEMTGYDDEVKKFWDRPPLSTIITN